MGEAGNANTPECRCDIKRRKSRETEKLGFGRRGTESLGVYTEAASERHPCSDVKALPGRGNRSLCLDKRWGLIPHASPLWAVLVPKGEGREDRMGGKQTVTPPGVQFFHTAHQHTEQCENWRSRGRPPTEREQGKA